VVSGEIVREEVEGGWPEDDVWFEFDIKECLDSQSGMNISFQIPWFRRAFNKISPRTLLPDGTSKSWTCRSARVERG
jgi:hypothetical protein